jgi:hypothetical protein
MGRIMGYVKAVVNTWPGLTTNNRCIGALRMLTIGTDP